MVFQLAYGLETVVLRVFTVYGSRQGIGEYGGVIAQFVRRLLVGEQKASTSPQYILHQPSI